MSKSQLPRYRENPFMTGEHPIFTEGHTVIKSKKKRVTVRSDNMVDNQTGEVVASNEIRQIQEVDDEQFVKVFTQNIKSFFSLKPAATRLLGLVLQELQRTPNADTIMLNMPMMERYFEEDGEKPLSKGGFYSAIEEMTIKGFIAPTDISKELYFINLHMFWNGDRIAFTKEYRRTQSKQQAMDFNRKQANKVEQNSTQYDLEDFTK